MKTLRLICCFFALTWFACTFIAFAADRRAVTPSARVETCLNVRAAPNIESAVVGKLAAQETADLLSEVPYWYRIRLFNGVEGYVHKSWSVVVNLLEAQESRIRVGSWNLKELGHGDIKDYSAASTVIGANFGLLAIVEVMQKQGAHPGYERLLQALGSNWAGLITDTPRPNNSSDANAEYYAVLYRLGSVRPCPGWTTLRYVEDNDGSPGDTKPDLFVREPGFGCFEAGFSEGGVGVDFLLGVYHARWSKGVVPKIQEEARNLDSVFLAMQVSRPGEKDVILAGDFNLIPEDLHAVVTAHDRTQPGSGSTLT